MSSSRSRSSFASPHVGILRSGVWAVRCAGLFSLGACNGGESRLEPAYTAGIAVKHDGPALDRLVRHTGLASQGRSCGPSPRASVAVEGRRGCLEGAEQRFFRAVAVTCIGVDIVTRAGQAGVDGPADVGGVIGVIALV
jgi:hypothetical protein